MRQTHVAGEKLFVDFAGDTVAVIDPLTGDIRAAHIFVAAPAPPTSPTRKGAGARGSPTGSARMSMRSRQSAV